MGGSESIEFMIESDAGEDFVATCARCGYAANVEKATSQLAATEDPGSVPQPERFPTPGVRTIEDLARFAGGAPAERQIKTLVYSVDGVVVLVLLRGDHALSEQKLHDQVEAREIRPANDAEIRAALGAGPGSLGAVGVTGAHDHRRLRARRPSRHDDRREPGRLSPAQRRRRAGHRGEALARPARGARGRGMSVVRRPLRVVKTIEVGHIFKLGTKYSEALGAKVLDEAGASRPIIMGSYGIGIERAMAAVVERSHDANGIVWPVAVAPYEVVVTLVKPTDLAVAEAGGQVYDALRASGIEVLLDDRDERPGVKFKDADLIGIPYRVTIGPKGIAEGKAEITRRKTGEARSVDLQKVASAVAESISKSARSRRGGRARGRTGDSVRRTHDHRARARAVPRDPAHRRAVVPDRSHAAYQHRVDAGGDAFTHFAPGNFGVFMGYDFHLTPAGPRLIEVNTNAGARCLNGLHTAALCEPARLACLCADLLPVETISERIVRTFLADSRRCAERARVPGSSRSRTSVRASSSCTRSSSCSRRCRRGGGSTEICDTSELVRAAVGVALRGERVDLVYLRDTDLRARRRRASAAAAAAYLGARWVVTSRCRADHTCSPNKQPGSALFSSRDGARPRLGVGDDAARHLTCAGGRARETLPALRARRERAWRERKHVGRSSRALRSAAAPSTAATRSRARSSTRSRTTRLPRAAARRAGLLEVETDTARAR
jgi:hypothetical protein